MGVAGQADGCDPGSDMLKGHFTRAKQLQADLGHALVIWLAGI